MKKNTICIPPSYSPHLEHTKKGKKKSLSPRQHREPQELLKPQPRTGAAGDAQSHGATLHLPAAPLRHTRHRKRAGNPSARINSSVLAPATCQRSGCTRSRDTGTPAPQKPRSTSVGSALELPRRHERSLTGVFSVPLPRQLFKVLPNPHAQIGLRSVLPAGQSWSGGSRVIPPRQITPQPRILLPAPNFTVGDAYTKQLPFCSPLQLPRSCSNLQTCQGLSTLDAAPVPGSFRSLQSTWARAHTARSAQKTCTAKPGGGFPV